MSLAIIKFRLLVCCVLVANLSAAQNYVLNPSFEDHINCPERLGNLDADVAHWSTPTEGSTDYFNACSEKMGTPSNFKGKQPSDFGRGYAGLYLYAPNNYREYLQVPLTKTLEKGKKYQCSFYISLAERSHIAVRQFGILFSKNKIQVSTKRELSKRILFSRSDYKYNFLDLGYSNFYADTENWILVSTQFVANGYENYLTIGNFKNNKRTRLNKSRRGAKDGAYYYVDMFSVVAVEDPSFNAAEKEDTDAIAEIYDLEETYVFKNLLFDFDTFRLHQAGKDEMLRLFNYIAKDESLHIYIDGHTDGIGPDLYNHSLSLKRAKEVANYLETLGLSNERIICRGFGGENPIATNETEEGRQQNRRVTFMITKNIN